MFSTDGVPRADRLRLFDEFQAGSQHSMRAFSGEPDLFRARVRAVDLGTAELAELFVTDSTVARSPALVRAADPDVYAAVIPLTGCVGISQARRESVLLPGTMGLYSSGHPFEVHIEADVDAPARLLRVQIPRALLSRSRGELESLLAVPIPSNTGVGGLFSQLLRGMTAGVPADQAAAYTHADLHRLGNITLDLFEAVVAHERDSLPQVGPHQQTLVSRITAFIRERLTDPDLSPETVAAAHHISVSYLHRLFENHDVTIAASIRAQRLDRARRDLVDPVNAGLPIHRIAERWGFRDHATFTRAFRSRYGRPPRAFRDDAEAV